MLHWFNFYIEKITKMKLHSLKVSGYKRLKEVTIQFGDATFLIGQNNCGKSSTIKAIEILLSARKQLPTTDFYSISDEDTGEVKVASTTIVLEAEFRNLPEDAENWRGFKGRIFRYDVEENDGDTGLSVIYRKTYELGKDVVIEFKSKDRTIKEIFKECKKPQEYIDKGLSEKIISEYFDDLTANIGKSRGALEKLELID
jgi:AAA15 family ATPase/GTPase